jgi:hypothetical protein
MLKRIWSAIIRLLISRETKLYVNWPRTIPGLIDPARFALAIKRAGKK